MLGPGNESGCHWWRDWGIDLCSDLQEDWFQCEAVGSHSRSSLILLTPSQCAAHWTLESHPSNSEALRSVSGNREEPGACEPNKISGPGWQSLSSVISIEDTSRSRKVIASATDLLSSQKLLLSDTSTIIFSIKPYSKSDLLLLLLPAGLTRTLSFVESPGRGPVQFQSH
jgi:hypothetical protein